MKRRSSARFFVVVTAFVSSGWVGMLVGVSFLATPIKFQAPSLDIEVALEVGRVTFAAFSKVEWGLALLLAIAVLVPRAQRLEIMLLMTVIVIVTFQAVWLLPILDDRVEAVIVGEPIPTSIHHMLYGLLEGLKAILLASVALVALVRLGWQKKPRSVAE